jgi:hypothetical protein
MVEMIEMIEMMILRCAVLPPDRRLFYYHYYHFFSIEKNRPIFQE